MGGADRAVVLHCPGCEVEWAGHITANASCWMCGSAGTVGRLPDLARISPGEIGWWAPARSAVDYRRRLDQRRRQSA